ncbi:ADP-ribose pyrophosphatase, mitochondrial-like [Sycon ciliatum]|uniref:ADP-ribose pyrophosphatase, mitochondrial-like n=1 Tax=Sycon ciliatum TaxID=27933 RepID=UPI0031F68130
MVNLLASLRSGFALAFKNVPESRVNAYVSSGCSLKPTLVAAMMLHTKARQAQYPGAGDDIQRFQISDDHVSWDSNCAEYTPVNYTAPVVLKQPVWADTDIRSGSAQQIAFNTLDGKIDRRSRNGEYSVVDGVPQNPAGRTGMTGRGLLGRWGPNHAADPIVTRWRRDAGGKVEEKNGQRVLEFVSIQRADSGAWAIPGGMVDPGENVSATLKREFGEEALNSLESDEGVRKEMEKKLDGIFHSGEEVYRGYVDDPRNTDNAWMETVAVNFHDDTGETLGKFQLQAGDDAKAVRWQAIDSDMAMYASHKFFLQKSAELRGANF